MSKTSITNLEEHKLNNTRCYDNFTNSDKQAPNLGIYYYKHEDTDSEMDKIKKQYTTTHINQEDESISEVTSDEELTGSVNGGLNENYDGRFDPIGNRMPKRKAVSEDTIRRLIDLADKLVTPDIPRILDTYKKNQKQKMRISKEEDSCDASGEDDERESQVSDYDVSTSTLKGLDDSNSENTLFSEYKSQEKEIWYGSCTSPLNQTCSTPRINNFSMSESALHNINLPKKLFNGTADSVNMLANGSNSTSSTVEEVSPHYLENPSPNRRKKRKSKTMFGKSDPYLMNSSPKQRSMLLKSCSFSGFSSKHEQNNDGSGEISPVIINSHMPHICDTSTTSGGDSDDDFHRRRPASFKMGIKTHYLNSNLRGNHSATNNLNMTEEQSSSLSEAWDNYQEEHYLSEPYSESRDSDAARRLLNFGEDYRNFMDSPSDCSAFSDVSPTLKRKQWQTHKPHDDEFCLLQLLTDSRNQFKYSEDIYKTLKDNLENHFITNEIDDLVSNCDRHIALINRIYETPDLYKISATDQMKMKDLLKQWRLLRNNSFKMQEYTGLLKQISETKNFINSIEVPDKFINISTSPQEDIKNEIDACKNLLKIIDLHYDKLTGLNAVVHRFSLDNQDLESSNFKLKSNVLELYELLENAKTLSMEKLEQMENLLPQWQTLESRLEQLRKDLQDDERNIDALDSLLNDGTFTDQTATGVRDIAKLLSESTYHQGHHINDILTEGSFSDSGISDEGSEHEIGERQGRLAAIRRLVRQFEAGLPVDSITKIKMREKINKIEEDLKLLQSRCRSLVSRTSACSSANLSRQQKDTILKAFIKGKDGDDDPEVKRSPVWYKNRGVKATLVFQVIIITFVCLSYFFNPQCCDQMNNYKWSLSPKLHFEGRPPI